jgi:hypothetical protein
VICAQCPRCGSRTLTIIESSIAMTDFEQTDGVIGTEGFHHHGCIFRVDCRCHGCGHKWKPRGAIQITDFDSRPETSGKEPSDER